LRTPTILVGGFAAAAAAAVGLTAAHAAGPLPLAPTSTPIKHVVVIFGENISFDHYFGTYPNAANPAGEPQFNAKLNTPGVNGLNGALLTNNPNSAQPQRLDRSEAVTCSNNHAYGAEQKAFDNGLMDKFVEYTAGGSCGPRGSSMVMDYYDGNTVTGLWNLAQNFSMSDNSYDTNFGPSTVGAINLISGNTHGASAGGENGSVIGDPDPSTTLDDCANGNTIMSGKNVGDLLNAHNVSWGWFEGGFRPTSVDGSGKATCGATHANVANGSSKDYIPHHEPFEYYASTANPHHLAPSSTAMIGSTDQANHNYDLTDFDAALAAGNLPSVSFLKAAAFEDSHPGNSDPLDEQRFIARTLDALQQSPEWSSTAVIIAYDDSDGWYDHQMSPIVSPSAGPSDALNGTGKCGNVKATSVAYNDRCGYGPRLPLLVISPYAKVNYVDHAITDQTSVLKFIEDNWQLGRIGDQSMDAIAGDIGGMFDFDPNYKGAPKVFLDPTTGSVLKTAPSGITVSPNGTPNSGDAALDVDSSVNTDDGSAPQPAGIAPAAAPAPAATPVPSKLTAGKAPKLTLSCATRGGGKKVSVSCKAKGGDLTKATALRFRIVKGNHVLATTRTTLSKKGTAKVTLRSKKALKKGKYTLRIAITQKGGLIGLSKTVKLA